MVRKRYYFPYVARNNPIFHLAVTSKTLIERVHEVTDVFKKYAENSDPKSPKHILYLMSQQNASLLQLSEYASEPKSDSTPPKVESSPESSSPGRSSSSISSLNQKSLSYGDSTKLDNDAPVSNVTDLASSSENQPKEFIQESASLAVAAKKPRSPARKSQKDINPVCIQEYGKPDDKAEMAQKPDSGSSEKEFKIPVSPVKEEKEVSKPAKRPRLFDKSLDKIPEFVSPVKKARTLIPSDEEEKMDISPNKSDKMRDSPSKDSNVSAVSSDKIESPQKIEHFLSMAPILKDDGIELDISSRSEETPGPSCTVSSAEMENLPDDASRVESIRKAVEERLTLSVSPNKTGKDVSPTKNRSSNRSPRKLRQTNSPRKEVPSTSRENPEVKSPSILSHPNVMTYLKLRFKSLLSHRNKYMRDIYQFFQQFNGDLRFLYFYSTNVSLAVKDIPTEGKAYFTRDARKLKANLIANATELSNKLRSLLRMVEPDIPFWGVCLREIRILNEEHEHFLTTETDSKTTVEFLRQYEAKLRIIWDRMDRRILLGDGLRSSLLAISENFMNLTRDFSKYLILVEIMKPSSLTSSEGEKRKLNISWR